MCDGGAFSIPIASLLIATASAVANGQAQAQQAQAQAAYQEAQAAEYARTAELNNQAAIREYTEQSAAERISQMQEQAAASQQAQDVQKEMLQKKGTMLASTNAAYGPDSWVNSLQYILACIFVLPYILFSPFVGWLADCFCKARIIQFMSFLQILVLGAMLLCYKYENIEMAVFWFCVFSVQATILSPAKKGVVKDMVGSRQLGYASGLMEMSLILSMLAAQIGIFAWFDILQVSSNDGWEAAAFPTFILTCIAVPVAIASLYLPRYPANQTRKFEWKLFYEHFVQLK